MTSERPRKRVLFLAEAATLAHVARPTVLARSLDPARFDVCVATGPDFRSVVTDAGLPVVSMQCIGTRAYLEAVVAQHNGNQSAAARSLGIHRNTLSKKLEPCLAPLRYPGASC